MRRIITGLMAELSLHVSYGANVQPVLNRRFQVYPDYNVKTISNDKAMGLSINVS